MRQNGRAKARLLLIERSAPESFASSRRDQSIARSDLNLLVGLSGRERTGRKYRALPAGVGPKDARTWHLPSEFSVIDAPLA
jgi:hypothetical protein